MIGFLTGKKISLKPTHLLLDVNGVGYSIKISLTTFEEISEKEIISLFIHTNVKEDSISLFGFFNESEKQMFELLISVSGVGPKIALSILSGIRVDDLRFALQSGDISKIIAVPGIGKKTAERLSLELRNKVTNIAEQKGDKTTSSIRTEAVSALITLGYNLKQAESSVRVILGKKPDINIEELLKEVLSLLSK
ncbi:MAG: Holliday junction branch migration protein RuvA [Ignavibacteriales bacterium CG_4_9_14_3_um_filter_30_11]|nr:MAG: Holliday junction branch migration protein RuvA [Ignavibacteriales bacterium CG_4_9_14_3_um_filter_30_11]